MGNQNNILGPSGGTPQIRDGALFANLTTDVTQQIKAASGILQRLTVNTAGLTSNVSFYDGLSSTVTMTIATPGVITWPKHGLAAGSAVKFTTTGALPTGLTAGTTYYVANDTNLTANTFAVSDTQAHALAGTNQINTTGTQSGTHTGFNVSTLIGTFSTLAQAAIEIGAYCALGLIAITTGGTPANITVLYN